jgi:hypothetical protein
MSGDGTFPTQEAFANELSIQKVFRVALVPVFPHRRLP